MSKINKQQKKTLIRSFIQFVKLQAAGNIIFLGTMLGIFLSEQVFHIEPLIGIAIVSFFANILYFYVDRDWVFRVNGKRRSHRQVVRFIIFVVFNFFLNMALIELFKHVIIAATPNLTEFAYYIALFLTGLVFAAWTYVGLKFWVFTSAKPYAVTIATNQRAKR